nr:unnamed protein product [Callosobruchus analis]
MWGIYKRYTGCEVKRRHHQVIREIDV